MNIHRRLAIVISLLFIAGALLSSCVGPAEKPQPYLSQYSQGTYEIWYTHEMGMTLSTVDNTPDKLVGYYICEDEKQDIYMILNTTALEGDPGRYKIFDLQTNELLYSGSYTCDASTFRFFPSAYRHDGEYLTKENFLPLFAREELVLTKISDTPVTDAVTDPITETAEKKE